MGDEKPFNIARHLGLRYNVLMHVISRKALRLFWKQHSAAQNPLQRWFKIMKHTDFENLVALRRVFPSADLVGDLIVFNIAGNKYRLITSIHFNRNKVYIRHVLTHSEYDKGSWKI